MSLLYHKLPSSANIFINYFWVPERKYGKKNDMKWTKEEISTLKNCSLSECYEKLSYRSKESIKYKRHKLGISSVNYWTDDENKIIAEHYATEGQNILERLPGRTWNTVRCQAYNLRRRGWKV